MRIFVVEPDGAGGMVHYAYQLCTALADEGADVTLVTGRHYELADLPHRFSVEPRMALWPAVGEAQPRFRFAASAVRVLRRARRAWRGVRYALVWHRLTTYILRERPDVVQFAIIRFPFQVLFLRRLRRAGITLTQICHEFEPRERTGLTQRLTRTTTRAVYRSFDRIYLHGDENRQRFLTHFDVPPERVGTIQHGNEAMFLDLVDDGIDRVHDHLRIPPDRRLALFFGGLRPSKGLDDLLDAWPTVRSEVDAHLLVCGQPAGVDPATLRDRAAALGVADSVTIDAGYLPLGQVAGVMLAADVVALPYRTATASGVLQVAYAFGLPVVATETGALAEDVSHGVTGLLVPPSDPAALGRALVKILADPAEATRMGSAARAESERFGWGPIARKILDETRELKP
jgi:glycosyltransferase involved in cell wall biosynthesis